MYIFTIILNDANGILDLVAIGSSKKPCMFNKALYL